MTSMRLGFATAMAAAAAMAACAQQANEEVTRSTEQRLDDANGNGNGNGNGHSKLDFTNPSGSSRTFSDNTKNFLQPKTLGSQPFFASLGTNGRACVHCHTPQDAWGLAAADVQYRFSHPLDVTKGCLLSLQSCPAEPNPANYGLGDPLFRPVDGAVSPTADVSTAAARQVAYAMLLTKGLVRIGIGIPANAEFTLAAVDDPYGYASAAELSLFRRPLPSTNLRLMPPSTKGNPHVDAGATTPVPVLNAVMWDGRETLPGRDIIADLLDQANGATLGHAQAIAGLATTDLSAIVDFETGLHTGQQVDANAGDLSSQGASGGPEWLAANQPFYYGINDVLAGDSQTGAKFDPNVFTVYTAWASAQSAARAAIARGEALFDSKPIAIQGVAGLNDVTGIPTIPGTCTSCHDSPNYGHHSVRLPIDIGLVSAARRTPDLPLYTLQNKTTGATVQVTDPGRALVTGKWADIGKFKGPILRGLAARAPYFHNGSAATLGDAVDFYDTRFGIGLSAQEKSDLVAFLQAL
jgi:cytochrome c peroxidase